MSKEKKLKIWLGVILGLGTFLLIGMGAAWFMLLMKPQNEELFKVNGEFQQLQDQAKTLASAKQALAAAEEKEIHLKTQLAYFRNRYRAFDYGEWSQSGPPKKSDGTPKYNDKQFKAYQEIIWRKQMQEFSYDYGPRLIGELRGAADASGVQLANWDKITIAVQDPPKGPEDLTIPPNGYYKPTGDASLPVEITGSLDHILAFFRIIHTGQILMKVGSSLRLAGSSPRITATFTVQPYLLVKGDGVVLSGAAATAPAGGAAGAAGGAPPNTGAPAATGAP